MDKRRTSSHKPDRSGFRDMMMLDDDSIYPLTYRQVRSIEISEKSYISYHEQFFQCKIEKNKAYRAILKANLDFWASWATTLNTAKIALIIGTVSSLIPLIIWGPISSSQWGKLIFHPIKLLNAVDYLIPKLIFAELIFFIALIWAAFSGMKVSVKVERASFLLTVVEDVIDESRSNSF